MHYYGQTLALGNSGGSTVATTTVNDELTAETEALHLTPAYLGFSSPSAIKNYLLSIANKRVSGYAPNFRGLPATNEEFALRLAKIGGRLPQDEVTLFTVNYSGLTSLGISTDDTWQSIGDPVRNQIFMAYIPAGWKAAFGACVDRVQCDPPGLWGTGWKGRSDKPTWLMLWLPFQSSQIPGNDSKGRAVRYSFVRTLDNRTQAQKDLARTAATVADLDTAKQLVEKSKESAKIVNEGKEILKQGAADLGEVKAVQQQIDIALQEKAKADQAIAQQQELLRVQAAAAGMRGGISTDTLLIGGGALLAVGLVAVAASRG